MAYDPDGNQVLVAYGSGNDSYKGKFRRATVSGLTVSFSEEFEYLNGTDGGYIACVYNTTDDMGVIIFKNDSASGYTQSVAVTLGSTNLTATNFLGISDAAISSAASGNITIKGGIAATGLSSLTPGSDYYAQGDGSISTTSTSPAVKIGKALSATAINLEYTS